MYELSKQEFCQLTKTKLGGSEGDLYLDQDHSRILKVFHPYLLSFEKDQNWKTIHSLYHKQELKNIAAIPEEIVKINHQFGFWMHYYQTGILLDQWIQQNDRESVIFMYKKISQILKRLHDSHILVSDLYYSNILIVDQNPIFIDVNSWNVENIGSSTISKILYDYSRLERMNRFQQAMYLKSSANGDKSALWLLFFESVFKLPVRKWRITSFLKLLEKQKVDPIIIDIAYQVTQNVGEIPYLHDVPYILK